MGLEIPELDDRSYDELVTDARKRIPVHSETWTDHNASDPGITMLEVLAWVAESDIYELDRLTGRHVRKYLRLLGVRPDPPRPATVGLDLDPPAAVAGTVLPEGVGLEAETGKSRRRFETAAPVALTDASVAAVVSETRDGRADNTRANGRDGLYYRPLGDAAADDAVYLGFDADPFGAGDRLDLFVDFHEGDLAAPASHGDEPVEFDPSASVVWEHCTDFARRYDPRVWHELPVRFDETTELYGGGTVSLAEPTGWTGADRALFDVDEPRYWLRARVETAHHEIPPQVNEFATNVVEAVDRVRYRDERLDRVEEGASVEATRAEGGGRATTARPNQAFVFPRAPVLDAAVTVGGTRWTEVVDLDASGPDAEHYVLDEARGVVRFGDGVRGEVPAPDQAVRATWYDRGGGEAGNVGADAHWRFADGAFAGVTVQPRGPATGGTDAESTDAALARLKADLRTPYRAVTPDDVRYLATHTPGLRFGRAAVDVEPRGDAGRECARHATVRVPVVPESTRDRPVPSPGFLEAVQCHLDRHRLLTDDLVAVEPTYVPVDVEVVVEVAEGRAVDRRLAAAGAALERFLDPLEGFDGGGWPFGRSVYRSEVYETVEGVDGVDCVVDVELSADPPGSRVDTGIDVPGTALVYLADATVTATRDGDRCGEWSR